MGQYEQYLSTHYGALGDTNRGRFRRESIRANLAAFIPDVKSAAILDIGPGLGDVLDYLLAERGLQNIEAIDISEEVAQYCSEKFCKTHLVRDPAEFLKERGAHYDRILMIHVLEHIKKDDAINLLQAIRTALRPGGLLVIEVPNMGNPLVGLTYRYGDFTHELGFTGSSLGQVLRLAGFRKVEVRPSRIPITSFARIAQFLLRGILEFLMRTLSRLYTTTVEINSPNLIAIAHADSADHAPATPLPPHS